MKRLLFLLPLALTGSVWLPPLSLAPSAATPMDFAAPATFPPEMPDWRTDPLGAAMREAARIDDPEHRAIERASMVAGLAGAGYLSEAEAVLDMAIEEALAWPLPHNNMDRANYLLAIAKRLAQVGIKDMTMKLLGTAVDEGGNAWLEAESSDYAKVALAVGSRETAEEAWEVLDWSPFTRAQERYYKVAPYLFGQGEREEALRLVKEFFQIERTVTHPPAAPWDEGLGDFHFVLSYIERYLTMGEPYLAKALIPEARERAKQGEDWLGVFYAQLRLSYSAHLAGDPLLAAQLVAESRLLAERSLDTNWWHAGGVSNWWRWTFAAGGRTLSETRSLTNYALVAAYADLGMWEDSRATLMDMDKEGLMGVWAFYWTGKSLANDGQEAAALEIVDELDRMGEAGRRPARKVLNAIALHHLEEGLPERAWELWREIGFPGRYELAMGLVQQWGEEGDLESLREYVEVGPEIGSAMPDNRREARGISDWFSSLAPALYTGGSGREDGFYTRSADDSLKAQPLIEIARILHVEGDQIGAIASMSAAERIAEEGNAYCEKRYSGVRRSHLCDPHKDKTQEQLRALAGHHIAAGWAAIGEFDRAIALTELLGPVEMAWVDVETGRFPRLEALRAIGIAMLEQGAMPESYLDNLILSLRLAGRPPAP